ncbi:Asparagine synthetase [Hortaea werneckii]|nr:Asparagine synthetase [Hortaea werneckii]
MNCIVRLSQIITSSKHIYSIQPKPLVPDRCLKQRKLPSNKNRRLREDEEQIPSPSSPSLAIQNTCISSLVRPILRREMLVEHTPVPVALLRIRTVLGIPVRLVLGHLLRHHLLIRDHLLRLVLEAVDPAVSHAVAELLLLAPEDVLGEVGMYFSIRPWSFLIIFSSGSRRRWTCWPVGSRPEVPAENLEHGRRSADGRHVVGLQVEDDVEQGELGDFLRGFAVRRVGQTDGEGVQLGEDGNVRETVVLVDAGEAVLVGRVGLLLHRATVRRGARRPGLQQRLLSRILLLQAQRLPLRNRRHQRAIQPTAQQNAIGHLSHQPLPDTLLERLTQDLQIARRARDPLGLRQPLRHEIPRHLVRLGIVHVARREGLDLVAHGVQTFELAGKVHAPGRRAAAAHVEGGDADRIPRRDQPVLLLVVQHPAEHAVESLCDLVVVDLAVDGEGDGFVVGEDGLRARVDADDGQALVYEDGRVRRVVAAPVRRSRAWLGLLDRLSHLTANRSCKGWMGVNLFRLPVTGEDAAHDGDWATLLRSEIRICPSLRTVAAAAAQMLGSHTTSTAASGVVVGWLPLASECTRYPRSIIIIISLVYTAEVGLPSDIEPYMRCLRQLITISPRPHHLASRLKRRPRDHYLLHRPPALIMRSALNLAAQRSRGGRSRSTSLSTVPPAEHSDEWDPALAAIAASILYRSPLPSREGRPVYILNAAAFPDSFEVDYDTLLSYVLARLPEEDELLSGTEYEIIFFAGGQPEGATSEKKNGPGIGWYLQAYHVLSRATRKKLQRLYIVHPRTWVRVLVSVFGTVVSPKFRRKITHINTLTQLALEQPIYRLLIPPTTYIHDRKLEPEITVPYPTNRRAFNAPEPFPGNAETGHTRLPRVLRETTTFILQPSNITTEGVFRIPPHSLLSSVLKEAYDRGQMYIIWKERGATFSPPGTEQALIDEIRLEDAYGVHLAASIIKTWYRDLRDPIFPESSYTLIRERYGANGDSTEVPLEDLVDLLLPASPQSPLAPTAREVLTRHLLPLLSRVASHESQNKMSSENLAIVFSMCLVNGSDQLEDAKVSMVIRKILKQAIEMWPVLREGMGIQADGFEKDLEPPVDPREFTLEIEKRFGRRGEIGE